VIIQSSGHSLVQCCAVVDDFQPSVVDASYSQSVIPKPRPIKASTSSLDLTCSESSQLTKMPSMSSEEGMLSNCAAFRPFRSHPPAVTTREAVSRMVSQVALSSQCSQPPTVKVSNTTVAQTITSYAEVTTKPSVALLSSSNGISALSAPLVASLMLHPNVSSFQLVSAIPAAHLATSANRAAATAAPSVQYIIPPIALSDTGSKLMQMVQTGVPATSQSGTQPLAGFQLAALPRAAIQFGSGPRMLMLCPQSQPQQQLHSSSLSSVVPVMMAAAASSQQIAASK